MTLFKVDVEISPCCTLNFFTNTPPHPSLENAKPGEEWTCPECSSVFEHTCWEPTGGCRWIPKEAVPA